MSEWEVFVELVRYELCWFTPAAIGCVIVTTWLYGWKGLAKGVLYSVAGFGGWIGFVALMAVC